MPRRGRKRTTKTTSGRTTKRQRRARPKKSGPTWGTRFQPLRDAIRRYFRRVVLGQWRFWAGLALFAAPVLAAVGWFSPRLTPWTAYWQAYAGGLWPLLGLLAAWAGVRLMLGTRVPWHPVRALGAGAALLGLLPLAHAVHAGAGGRWGQALLEGLVRSLGGWGAGLALLAWFVLALAWLLDRPLWPYLERLSRPSPAWKTRLHKARRQWRRWQWQLRRMRYRQRPVEENPPLPPPKVREERLPPVRLGTPTSATAAPGTQWVLPDPARVLDEGTPSQRDETWAQEQARIIEETLAQFGVPVRVVTIRQGPTVTLFGVEPGYVESKRGRTRVRVSKILSLADDLALALAAKRLRVQAPVPGQPYVGIEVPNETPNLVPLRRVIETPAFGRVRETAALPLALGQDVSGEAVVAALETMPHLLIAGATGAGKSVCLHAMLMTWLLFRTPDQVRLLLIDPKRVELTRYNGLPHLITPVVTDLEKAQGALQWALQEMDTRYRRLARLGARSLAEYNQRAADAGEEALPYIVVVIDELADLMMLAPQRTEQALIRLAQLARATGIHLVVATQRPSVDVVTGLIKANFPARIAFAVASQVDSRVVLDRPGAERLLGRGDMLFLPPDAAEPIRVQGSYVTDAEVFRVIQHWQLQGGPRYRDADAPLPRIPLKRLEAEAQPQDPLTDAALQVIREEGRASITLLQRRLGIGYTRAARLLDQIKARGLLPETPTQGDE